MQFQDIYHKERVIEDARIQGCKLTYLKLENRYVFVFITHVRCTYLLNGMTGEFGSSYRHAFTNSLIRL